jgi:hypothetical protein
MVQAYSGEQLEKGVFPRADLAAEEKARFVVRNGDTYLLCGQSEDGVMHFPAGPHASAIEVGPRGMLYSHSTVHVSASRETPYTIGYVDFPNGLRVLASVRGADAGLGCDVPVRLENAGGKWFVVPVAQEVKP